MHEVKEVEFELTHQLVWVCLAALAILDSLDMVDTPTLAAWLSERQLPSGGLNGRPEKLEDVCYSWWDLASLSILGKLHWINRDKLISFILESQVRLPPSSLEHLIPYRTLYTTSLLHSSPLYFASIFASMPWGSSGRFVTVQYEVPVRS